jgi:hypothetical protein
MIRAKISRMPWYAFGMRRFRLRRQCTRPRSGGVSESLVEGRGPGQMGELQALQQGQLRPGNGSRPPQERLRIESSTSVVSYCRPART